MNPSTTFRMTRNRPNIGRQIKHDDYAYAAIIHDYIYWTQVRPREMADEMLKLAMQDFDVANWKINTIYAAVSSQGKRAWDVNARLKAQGEKRILKEFPPKGRINWAEWKKRPNVFADL